jgi:hypothetical protein
MVKISVNEIEYQIEDFNKLLDLIDNLKEPYYDIMVSGHNEKSLLVLLNPKVHF